MYVDGRLVRQYRDLPVSSTAQGAVSVGVWFPNAWAGQPQFGTCAATVDDVKVFDLAIAGDRWCELEAVQLQLACAVDADCGAWVTDHCMLPLYEALCVTATTGRTKIVDASRVGTASDSDTVVEDAERAANMTSAATAAAPTFSSSRVCQFRLQPTHAATARERDLHLATYEAS